MATTASENLGTYDAGQIQVLKGLEAVRKRPGHVHRLDVRARPAPPRVRGRRQLDRRSARRATPTRVDVTIHADNSITVDDNGRGIPVDMHPTEKMPGVELAMTVLHAGGKFDKDSYKVSGGLHGVGVSVVNALSEQLKVWVKRDGKEHYMDFARGDTHDEAQGARRRAGKKETRHEGLVQAGRTDLHRAHLQLRHARARACASSRS